jgi:hypothetical protein
MEVLNLIGFLKYPQKQCKDSTGGATQNITIVLQIPFNQHEATSTPGV